MIPDMARGNTSITMIVRTTCGYLIQIKAKTIRQQSECQLEFQYTDNQASATIWVGHLTCYKNAICIRDIIMLQKITEPSIMGDYMW